MNFKQTITWHTAEEKPNRERYILFLKKDDPYSNPFTGYYKNGGVIHLSNSLPGLDKCGWDQVRCWTELSDFLSNIYRSLSDIYRSLD